MTKLRTEKMEIASLYKNSVIAVLIWAAMFVASFAWNYMHESDHILHMARNEALTAFNKNVAFRYWGTKHGGAYVPATVETPPNKYLKHIAERDITTPSGKKLTLMNPAYMVRQMMEEYSEFYGVGGHITSLKPLNPDNAPDDWERRALKSFENGIEEVFEIAHSATGDNLRLMRPLVTKKGCLKCHAHQGYKTGDIRGGISTTVSMSAYYDLKNHDTMNLIVTHGLIWLFGMIAFGFIFRQTKIRLIERKRSIAELQKYKHIISATADHMSFLDRNYIYQAVNDSYLEAWQKTRQEIVGHSVADLLGADVYKRFVKKKLDRCLAGERINYQAWFDYPDSGRRYMDVCYYPFCEAGGFVSGVSVCVHDITERKLKDDELRDHKEHLEESVVERTLELTQAIEKINLQKKAVMNMALDLEETNNKLQKREHELEERVKELNCLYELSKLVEEPENTIPDILQGVIELIPSAWQYPDITSVKLVLNGEEFKTMDYEPPKWWQRSDIIVRGEKQGFLEVSYRIRKPEVDEGAFQKEERLLLEAVTQRLSKTVEHKQAEEALRESEEKYRLITETSMLGIFSANIQGNIIFANDAAAKMFGYTHEEIIGKHFSAMLGKRSLEKGNTLFEKLLSGKNVEGDITALRKNEREFPIFFSLSPIIKNDEAVGVTGVIQDITEKKKVELALKKAKESAEAANRLKSEFLANMSHEIRTPMNAILGFTEILKGKVRKKQNKHYMSLILSSGRSLMTLINDILDLSKIEAGKLKIEYEPTDIVSVFKEVASVFSQEIEKKGLKFILETDLKQSEYLLLDEIRTRQILLNLMGNAVKFTQSGSVKLTAKTRAHDKSSETTDFIFAVQDTGIGISEEYKKTIFNAFEQQPGQDHPTYGGTGLGLAITKRLAEAMGGAVTVSGEEGKGSVFTVTLKNVRKAEAADAPEKKINIPADSVVFDQAVILIADDIQENRMLLRICLDDHGFEFIEAEDGRKAVNLATEHHPDLILMDMKMPVMDGHEATRIIKANHDTRQTPVIAVTAAAMKDEEKKIALLCDGYLKKPVNQDKLIAELTRFLKYSIKAPEHSDTACPESEPETGIEQDSKIYVPNPEMLAKLPVMIQILKTEFMPRQEEINDMLIIDDVQEFAEDMTSAGRKHGFPLIVEYGEHLADLMRCYDIVGVKKKVAEFPQIIEKLRGFINKGIDKGLSHK